jgi:hypothetical protein
MKRQRAGGIVGTDDGDVVMHDGQMKSSTTIIEL